MRVIETVSDMQADIPQNERAVVMTMGALHDGHATLMDRAREIAGADGQVLVSVFVNPTQFGAGEDYDRYPRTWEADLAVCAAHGVDAVFAPTADDLYSAGTDIMVDPGPLGTVLEGAVRPGHFRGVLTVVAKLLHTMQPSAALFGEKDYQQLVLIRRMAGQLNFPVAVVGVPTVRDGDGVALSSRNAYLSDDERRTAGVIPRATEAGRAAAAAGATPDEIVASVQEILTAEADEVDYVVVTGPDLGPAPDRGAARLILAARVGSPRLLDNVPLTLAAP